MHSALSIENCSFDLFFNPRLVVHMFVSVFSELFCDFVGLYFHFLGLWMIGISRCADFSFPICNFHRCLFWLFSMSTANWWQKCRKWRRMMIDANAADYSHGIAFFGTHNNQLIDDQRVVWCSHRCTPFNLHVCAVDRDGGYKFKDFRLKEVRKQTIKLIRSNFLFNPFRSNNPNLLI